MDFPLNIALFHGGSIGDNLNLTCFAAAVRRKFPNSIITAFVNRNLEVFEGNPVINTIIQINPDIYWKSLDEYRNKFDLFFDIRYAVKCDFSEKALKVKEVAEYRIIFEKHFKKYVHLFDSFLGNIEAHDKTNKKFYELFFDSCGLDGNINEQFLQIKKEDYKKIEKYKNLRFFIVNNSARGGIQTKSWSFIEWEKITRYLNNIGFTPIQVGIEEDIPIAGAIRFTGTLAETAALIKESWGCITIEGGIAHIAKTVGTDSIVLFGSTSISMFGYDNNINLRSSVCSPCWWRKPDWFSYCSKLQCNVNKSVMPPCMENLKAEKVIDAVHELIERRGLKMQKYIEPNNKMDKGSLMASVQAKIKDILETTNGTEKGRIEQAAFLASKHKKENIIDLGEKKKVDTLLSRIKSNKKVLVIGDTGKVSELLIAQGNNVKLVSNSEIITVTCKYLLKIDSYLASSIDFPFKDSSFDCCVVLDTLGNQKNMGAFLEELERVTKTNGSIILALAIPSGFDGKSSQLWAIQADTIDNRTLILDFKKTAVKTAEPV